MRFNCFIIASLLFTFASGLTIPSNTLSERDTDLEARENLFEDSVVEIVGREPKFSLGGLASAFKPKYHVKAGGGKPAQTYTHKEVKHAVHQANQEHQRINQPGMSNRQKKLSPLKAFKNNNHHLPKKAGARHAKTFPKMKGTGHEYPLPNKNPHAPTGSKGPARVIMKEKNGKLKFKGVVAHDQSRPHGSTGANDHFRVKGKINPFKKQ